MKGQFIVIEGLEGAGKSSAVATIVKVLSQYQLNYQLVREPGGTPLAEALRELIKGSWDENVTPPAELMVMYAARAQLVENVIKPALVAGRWVIGDRHDLSSQAYQGGGRQLGREMLEQMREITLGEFRPQLTLYLDIDPTEGLKRAQGRGELDRIEQEALPFFERTRNRYLELAEADPTVTIIDANQSLDRVQEEVCRVVTEHIEATMERRI